VTRQVQGVLLLLVGGMLLRISWTGSYVRYVKPAQLPLLLAAGVAMLALAAVALWPRRTGRHAVAAAADGHGHGHAGQIGWLFLLPAIAVLALAPPALGTFQAARNGTAVQLGAGSSLGDIPPGDPVRMSLYEYATRAVSNDGQSLQGRTVTLTGFIMPGPSGAVYLTRLRVTCCAADARPVKVGLDGNQAAGLAEDTWVEVDGTYDARRDADALNGAPIPFVAVTALRSIPAPAVEYET
jgi:uncharacterized repeat protein (TIGR03943 family)